MTQTRYATMIHPAAALAAAALLAAPATAQPTERRGPGLIVEADAAVQGWLSWRGPNQNGTSDETGLPDTWDPADGGPDQWTYDLAGRGTPVIADGRVYTCGYEGRGPDLQEVLICLDAATGTRIWEHRFSDFFSDVIYNRYAIGSPTIDPRTGDVYAMTAAGLLNCFSRDGELQWQRSMMEEYGRLTFPNGRTGSPVIDDDLVIIHVISSNWGPGGPARDRFYAFDTQSGELVWWATPGVAPKDSSFSMPVLAWEDGRRVLYAGTGCGNLVCIDARTGEPIWRYQMSIGGVNSSPVLTDERIIEVHGKENLDSSVIGRMIALPRSVEPVDGVVPPDREIWRNDLAAFTSSPVLVDDRVYLTDHTGELSCVNVATGEILWHEKLAPSQIHASPLWADGKLYVPMNNGLFHIVRPTDDGPEILSTAQLEGNCLGAPAVWNGRVYVHTTEKLYCFGAPSGVTPQRSVPATRMTSAGEATQLQVIPAEAVVAPGATVDVRVRSLDAKGRVVDDAVDRGLTWSIPPNVPASMKDGMLTLSADAAFGATVLSVSHGSGLEGSMRLRVVPDGPFTADFDDIERTVPDPDEPGAMFAFPPSHWLSSRPKWQVRELDGEQVLARRLDNPLFQRAFSFIGHPDMSSYTAQVDIRSDGRRRMMSSAGIINQRYLITLKGNHQELEVSSNHERIKEAVPFRWRPNVWYTLKTRVDTNPDGSAVVRGKVWPRDENEPDAWTIEYVHTNGHTHGGVGIFGFTPQSRFRVYLDNLQVTQN